MVFLSVVCFCPQTPLSLNKYKYYTEIRLLSTTLSSLSLSITIAVQMKAIGQPIGRPFGPFGGRCRWWRHIDEAGGLLVARLVTFERRRRCRRRRCVRRLAQIGHSVVGALGMCVKRSLSCWRCHEKKETPNTFLPSSGAGAVAVGHSARTSS